MADQRSAQDTPANADVEPDAKDTRAGTRAVFRSRVVSAGAGAAGGTLLTSLFGSLKVGDALQNPLIATPGYPLVIFSVVALFILIAGLMTINTASRQFLAGMCGVALFAATATLGAVMMYQGARAHPQINIFEHFSPDLTNYKEDKAEGPRPVALEIEFNSTRLNAGADKYKTFSNGLHPMIDGDSVEYRIRDLDVLWQKYLGRKVYIKGLCANSPDPICKTLNEDPQ